MGMPVVVIAILALIAIPVGIVAVLYLIVPFFKAVGWLCRQVGRFVYGEVSDALRIVGALITQVVLLPMIVGSVVIGRWSAAGHYGRALTAEMRTLGLSVYRMAIGHPARLLCLTALTDGIEKRIPEVVAAAPGADAPSGKRAGQFEGYRIVGSLPGGGSGGKLYVAEPDELRLAGFARNGATDVGQVVIKVFSLRDGSSLPQIVRESRALEAAKKLGLVLEHELSEERFYYVTRYVPGESLGIVTQRLHALSEGGEGLDTAQLRRALGYGADLLSTLDAYHRGGLWHKDVKPDNIVVDGRAAHLVDFGLVTPLRSGMTLTTHGTEYFRDPEMVRLALRGVKVHQVDGAKFDLYAAGAVLYSMVENSFPAHGGLSQISKRCPEALRWVIRRAMTEYDKRYTSASQMLADLEVVRTASDPWAIRPADLPSLRGQSEGFVAAEAGEFGAAGLASRGEAQAPAREVADAAMGGASVRAAGLAGSPVPPREGSRASGRRRPNIRVSDWWSGRYEADEAEAAPAATARGGPFIEVEFGVGERARRTGRLAQEQVRSARARARARRERAQQRAHQRRAHQAGEFRAVNPGVVVALLVLVAAAVAVVLVFFTYGVRRATVRNLASYGPEHPMGLSFAEISLPEATGLAPAGTVRPPQPPALPASSVSRPHVPAPMVVVTDRGQRTASTAQRDSEPWRVLVVSDVQPPTGAITAAVERLQSAGFLLVGNYPGNGAGEATMARELDLVASARRARELGRLDAEDVRAGLSRWLSEQDLPLLVWFERDASEPTRTTSWLIAAAPGEGDGVTISAAFAAGRSALAPGAR